MGSNSTRESLSIGPELVPRWLSCFKFLHYDHILLCRANAAWGIQWRSRVSWKCKFFHIAKCWIFLFDCFWENILFNSHVSCYVTCSCRKRSNSCSQMFSKTGVVKNCAIFTGKNLCWSLFWIKFRTEGLYFYLKRDSNARCFCVNVAKFFWTAFLLKTCSLYLFETFIWC